MVGGKIDFLQKSPIYQDLHAGEGGGKDNSHFRVEGGNSHSSKFINNSDLKKKIRS